MFKKKKEVYRHSDEMDYRKLISKLEQDYPGETIEQIKSTKELDPRYTLMAMAELTSQELNRNQDAMVTLSAGQLDYIYRAILDLATHTQKELPEGVYQYSLGNLNGVTNFILEKVKNNKDLIKVKGS